MKIISTFLLNTGERPLLMKRIEDINDVLAFSYRFVKERVKNNDLIFDYGCGGGYGTEFLSRFTKNKVFGFDLSKNIIELNNAFFSRKDNLKFTHNLNIKEKFDIITSFQVIEHIEDNLLNNYFNNIKNILKNDGVFFISTVNKNITSYQLKKPIMPFHIKEYTPNELVNILKKYFSSVNIYGQITSSHLEEVRNLKKSYINKKFDFKYRILRLISQFEIIRSFSRIIPINIKSIIFNYKEDLNSYELVDKINEIDNAYILICECRK